MDSITNHEEFPKWALLPKKETGVLTFLAKYPNYDGRGITIAVFDSGIDPSAPGLQITSEGKPKIIEMMDASGAGDVDTSLVIENQNGSITGLSGRTLKIPSTWKNPTNKYHVGIKNAFDLYPKALKERIEKERKEKEWNAHHKLLIAETARRLQDFETKHKSKDLNLEDKLLHEDLEAQLEALNHLDKKYNDLGPVFDCVVFHDGEMWRACLDTSETGDLEKCTLLGPYGINQQYATLSEKDLLSYSVNIHEEGNILEIVGMSTNHGTHVASITAAYFPDEPEKNGIAPGAQIVSIGIGDIRLGSMETGTALVRAIIKVMELKCDVINLSYGEHSHWSEGRIMNLVHEVVNNHGVIMVSSAGNHGPALSTVGTPPFMYSSSVIGVAAYCSTEMMKANYCLRELLPGTNFSWSSRGPTMDGDIGVSICAPGGAITSVPRWTLRGVQLMNGTSMSSPHVSGSIAILLSGLKDKNIPYSPYSVRRAIENTALKVEKYDVFSMGHGLLQVDKAFDHLQQYEKCPARDIRFDLSCGAHSKGIYYRETNLIQRAALYNLTIEPIFLNEAEIDPQKKLDFRLNLKLVVGENWVSVGTHLNLYYASRSINIKVDPVGLSPGIHYTAIQAFDGDCPEKGILFQFPVTVVIPKKPVNIVNPRIIYKDLPVNCSQLYREFIAVPPGATWAELTLESLDSSQDAHFVLHAVQLQKFSSCKTLEYYKMFHIPPLASITHVFSVKADKVIELCIGKWWSSIGLSNINLSVEFHGLEPNKPSITMHAADGLYRIDVDSKLNYEELAPTISLKHHAVILRPAENKITPLGKRDIVPVGRQIYELVLTYNFNVSKTTEVTPICFLLSDQLYESEYESQLWLLYDSNKRLVTCGDAYPSKYTIKLDKGDYTLKFQVRQEQRAMLEKITDMPLSLLMKLSSTINLDVFNSHSSALVGGKKLNSKCMLVGSSTPLYIAPLASDKVPKGAQPGHYLLGTISYAKDESAKKVNAFPFRYVLTEFPQKKSSKNNNSNNNSGSQDSKEKNVEDEFAEALRDLKISWLSKLDEASATTLFNNLQTQDPAYVPLYYSRLQALDSSKERINNLPAILNLADKIIDLVDSKELLASLGTKKEHNVKNLEKQRSILIDTLVKKGLALCDLMQPSGQEEISIGDGVAAHGVSLEDVDLVYKELLKWVDPMDSKAALFMEQHAIKHKHYGRAIKILHRMHDEKPTAETEKKCIDVYGLLNWKNCVRMATESFLAWYPPQYRLF